MNSVVISLLSILTIAWPNIQNWILNIPILDGYVYMPMEVYDRA